MTYFEPTDDSVTYIIGLLATKKHLLTTMHVEDPERSGLPRIIKFIYGSKMFTGDTLLTKVVASLIARKEVEERHDRSASVPHRDRFDTRSP